ncbi:ParA family protein [Sutcliffiella sp. NC1]|uniref:ParA family protein n=1 Tax=Sutcliffiella sp. NC1 TaxID=3004096 RepID=UPI0022DDB68A|nr:AAA family ATPase [Sutcliffiella sp. NC1]WBL16903.1 AAA family ATPase [Sutcliffiella sp. NC1]
MGRAKKIFVGNYKGGVGKTTSVYYLAHYLAERYKILLVDLDPQCSLSEICLKSTERDLMDLRDDESLNFAFDMYLQSKKLNDARFSIDTGKLIKNCSRNHRNIDFIPSNLFYSNGGLDDLAIDMTTEQAGLENLFILHNFLLDHQLEEKYDLIIFDCPPTNNLITQSGFLLSDYFIIPTIMDKVSTKGVAHYIKIVNKIYDKYCANKDYAPFIKLVFGDKPKLLGVFETMRKGPSLPQGQSELGDVKMYETAIKHLNSISEALSNGEISPEHLKYKELADEVKRDLDPTTLEVTL